jgi:hypothetical protein
VLDTEREIAESEAFAAAQHGVPSPVQQRGEPADHSAMRSRAEVLQTICACMAATHEPAHGSRGPRSDSKLKLMLKLTCQAAGIIKDCRCGHRL